ncbi:MAG: NfeD family protein, partial [Burkholderiaceae bacterium]|nr:NfeD family protein [Burkholderiaceae bacterium]
MAGYVWWFVIGFGLLVAELLSGTFYLLVIAVAMGVAGLVALAGAPFALQLVVAAAIGLGGSLWLRSTRFGKRLH